MVVKTDPFSPGCITTGPQMEMTLFRAHDAGIALRQLGEAGVTVTLTETFIGWSVTGTTMDVTFPRKGQAFSEKVVDWELFIVEHKRVCHRCRRTNAHLIQMAGKF